MTEEQKHTIVRFRRMGVGYRKMAIALGILRDKVHNYCKSQDIDTKTFHESKEWKKWRKCASDLYTYSAAIQMKSTLRD